jgi:hypothetical protein
VDNKGVSPRRLKSTPASDEDICTTRARGQSRVHLISSNPEAVHRGGRHAELSFDQAFAHLPLAHMASTL